MSVLEGVLLEEKNRLESIVLEYKKMLDKLPNGAVYIRKMNNSSFVYRRRRQGGKIISEYLGSINEARAKEAIENYNERKRIKSNLRIAKSELIKIVKVVKTYE